MSHIPHGVCVVINNEKFQGAELKNRAGTHQDESMHLFCLWRVVINPGYSLINPGHLSYRKLLQIQLKKPSRSFFTRSWFSALWIKYSKVIGMLQFVSLYLWRRGSERCVFPTRLRYDGVPQLNCRSNATSIKRAEHKELFGWRCLGEHYHTTSEL